MKSIFLFFSLFLIFGLSLTGEPETSVRLARIKIGSQVLKCEIADTAVLRAKGLMHRTYLPMDQGMLFIFEKEEQLSMWMKNTLISLDILWLNKEKEIIHAVFNAKALSETIMKSDIPALYVIEFNSGILKDKNALLGKKVKFLRL